jgi:hypothetical protein
LELHGVWVALLSDGQRRLPPLAEIAKVTEVVYEVAFAGDGILDDFGVAAPY